MEFPRIALRATNTAFNRLIELGNALIVGLTGNVNFPTPNPTIAQITTDTTDVEQALTKAGTAGNRGTTADYRDLVQKSTNLHLTLKRAAQYVANAAEAAAGQDYEMMAAIMLTSGLELAKPKVPVGVLAAPQNFRQLIDINVAPFKVKLRWKRPLNTNDSNDVSNYLVMRSLVNDPATAVQVASVTKGEYIDTNTTGDRVQYFYWIIPCNAYGMGVPSQSVAVTLAAAF